MVVKKNQTNSLVKHLETLVEGVKNQLANDTDNRESIQQDLILIISTAVELSDELAGVELK